MRMRIIEFIIVLVHRLVCESLKKLGVKAGGWLLKKSGGCRESSWTMALSFLLPDPCALAALNCRPVPKCYAWAFTFTKDRRLLVYPAYEGFQSLKERVRVFCKVRRKVRGACVMLC